MLIYELNIHCHYILFVFHQNIHDLPKQYLLVTPTALLNLKLDTSSTLLSLGKSWSPFKNQEKSALTKVPIIISVHLVYKCTFTVHILLMPMVKIQ